MTFKLRFREAENLGEAVVKNLCDVIVPGNLDVTTPEITQLSASTMNAKQTRLTGLPEMLVHETFRSCTQKQSIEWCEQAASSLNKLAC